VAVAAAGSVGGAGMGVDTLPLQAAKTRARLIKTSLISRRNDIAISSVSRRTGWPVSLSPHFTS
jgi:hypothetical protein